MQVPLDLLFHGTDAAISTFRPFSHFGTREQALFRVRTLAKLGSEDGALRLYPVRLTLTRPLRVDDVGDFDSAGDFADGLERVRPTRFRGLASAAIEAVDRSPADYAVEGEARGFALIARALADAGYDGICYRNDWEGEGFSWMNLRSDQATIMGSPEFRPLPVNAP